MDASTLAAWVSIGVVAAGGLIWGIRQEGRITLTQDNTRRCQIDSEKDVMELKKDIVELRLKHEALDGKVVGQLQVLIEKLAKIEGWLFRDKGE